jgi:hypothetical protein
MAMYISKNHLNSSIGRRMLNLQVMKPKKHNRMFTKEKKLFFFEFSFEKYLM